MADGGDDSAYGGAGNDELVCASATVGLKEFFGGSGVDTLVFFDLFETGFTTSTASRLVFDAAHSVESVYFLGVVLRGTSGNDLFDFSGTNLIFEDVNGARITPKIDMGAGNDKFTGNVGNREIVSRNLFGNAGNDSLFGEIGVDTLDGGTGADVLVGGKGADIYIVDNVADSVREEVIDAALDEGLGGGTPFERPWAI